MDRACIERRNGGDRAIGGWLAQSTGVLADAVDMFSDAAAYAIALAAIGRSGRFKTNAGTVSGFVLLCLGIGILVEVARRTLFGSEPVTLAMIGLASLSLTVNLTVLAPASLSKGRGASAHHLAFHARRCHRQLRCHRGRGIGLGNQFTVSGPRDRSRHSDLCRPRGVRDPRRGKGSSSRLTCLARQVHQLRWA